MSVISQENNRMMSDHVVRDLVLAKRLDNIIFQLHRIKDAIALRLLDMLTARRMHFKLPKTGSVSDEVGIACMEIADGPVCGGTEPNGHPSE